MPPSAEQTAAGWPRRPQGARPFVVAHRGGGGEAPENTLAAFAAAATAGAYAIEFDITALADGTLVVTHDEELAALGLAAARAAFPALPTLDETLAWFAAGPPQLRLHADLKAVDAVAELVAALDRHGVRDRTVVSCTDAGALRRLGQCAPGVPLLFGYPQDRHGASRRPLLVPAVTVALAVMRAVLPLRIARLVAAAGADVAALERRVVSAATVRRCHAKGIAVHVWTVDDPREAQHLARLGVDAIVTDLPRLVAGTLAP